MFLSTRNQTIVHHIFLELLLNLLDIDIENPKLLSMLFSYFHFAFTRNLGHKDR